MDLFLESDRRGTVHNYYRCGDSIKCGSSQYEIGDRLARGGNAVLHRCYLSTTGDEYAVKFQLRLSSDRIRRFNREQGLLKMLEHEHLVRYKDHGSCWTTEYRSSRPIQEIEIPYLIMELADDSLTRYLRQGHTIPYDIYIGQFRGLSSALVQLHKHAIHRDIKPANILVKGERWLLSDFGLCAFLDPTDNAELTRVGEKIGPNNWMSPEENTRIAGFESEIKEKTDIFQLAAVFWLVVTHRHPSGTLTRADWTGTDKLFLPLFKALQHDPARRQASAQQFADEILQAIEA